MFIPDPLSQFVQWPVNVETLMRRTQHRRTQWAQTNSNTTPTNFGFASALIDGTASFVQDTQGKWINMVCPTGAGAGTGRVVTTGVRTAHLPVRFGTIQTGASIADLRYWLGIMQGSGATPSSDDPSDDGYSSICLRYSSGSPNWFLTCTSTTVQSTPVDTGIPVAVSTYYNWAIVVEYSSTSQGTRAHAMIGEYNQPLRYAGWIDAPSDFSPTTDLASVSYLVNKSAATPAFRWKMEGVNQE